MIETSLQKIGLTDGEVKVYLALSELGSSSITKIIKKSGVSGSKTYEVLDRLAKKSLISTIVRNNVQYFETTSPDKILDYLDEKKGEIEAEKKEIHKIIPQLILRQKNSNKCEAKIFTGWEGLKTVNQDIIKTLRKGEEWLSMGLTEQPESWEIYFNKKQEERAKKGIILRHLINQKYYSLYNMRKHLPYTEFRFLREEFEMPTSIEIYRNKVLILILIEQNPMAIMVESEAVANSFRKYFEAIWRLAKT